MERATLMSSALGTGHYLLSGWITRFLRDRGGDQPYFTSTKWRPGKKGRKLFESVGSICNLFDDLAQTRRYHVMK